MVPQELGDFGQTITSMASMEVGRQSRVVQLPVQLVVVV
jgi:hypothetical protein